MKNWMKSQWYRKLTINWIESWSIVWSHEFVSFKFLLPTKGPNDQHCSTNCVFKSDKSFTWMILHSGSVFSTYHFYPEKRREKQKTKIFQVTKVIKKDESMARVDSLFTCASQWIHLRVKKNLLNDEWFERKGKVDERQQKNSITLCIQFILETECSKN